MTEFLFFLNYKYVALTFFAIVEGPITSLVSGFLIRIGYLSLLPTIIILVGGDIVSDTIYYYLAIKGNGEKYVKKYSKKYKTIADNFNMLDHLWRHHGRVTMFLGKFAYGFTVPLVVSAALSKVSYKKLMAYIIPPTIIKYSILMGVGYYLAHSYQTAEKYIYLSAIYAPIIVLAFFFGYKIIIRYLKGKAKNEDEK